MYWDTGATWVTPSRLCPGRHFAENSLWAAVAVMLSVLRFEKAKDSMGNDIDIKLLFRAGVARCDRYFELLDERNSRVILAIHFPSNALFQADLVASEGIHYVFTFVF